MSTNPENLLPALAGSALREAIQEKYGAAARQARTERPSCCGGRCGTGPDPISSNLYTSSETAEPSARTSTSRTPSPGPSVD